MHSYRNNPEANRSAFRDGWFRTGDLGRLDAEGFLFVTGRIKEMINRGGEKILPGEIEDILMDASGSGGCSSVWRCAPDPRRGRSGGGGFAAGRLRE